MKLVNVEIRSMFLHTLLSVSVCVQKRRNCSSSISIVSSYTKKVAHNITIYSSICNGSYTYTVDEAKEQSSPGQLHPFITNLRRN